MYQVLLLDELVQRLAQCLFGPVETGFDGFRRAAQHTSDLGVRQAVVFCEHQSGSLILRQLRYRRGNPLAYFTSVHLIGGGRDRLNLQDDINGFSRMPCPPTQVIDGRVMGQSEEPSRKLYLEAICVELLLYADEDLLRNVVGVVSIADRAVNEIYHGAFVAPHEFIKGITVAGLDLPDDIEI